MLNRWSFNAACLGKTPYLLSSTGATDHTIESGAAAAAPAPTRILELATAASRRRQRVGPIAGRSADQRCWVGAALVRASQWIKRRNAPLNRWSFNAACLGKTPYLLSSTGATDHTIESGHAATPPTP